MMRHCLFKRITVRDLIGRLCAFGAALIIFSSVFYFLPVSAFAMNEDYLDKNKWQESNNISFEEVYAEAAGNELHGMFGYYIDDELCVYTYFLSHELNDISCKENAKIIYEYHFSNEDYTVVVEKDGIGESTQGAQNAFAVMQNFGSRLSDPYISAVQYLGRSEDFSVSIYFYLDEVYTLHKDISVEVPTTTKAEKQSTTKKPTTTKEGKTTKAESKTKGKTSEKTTKFKPNGPEEEDEAIEYETEYINDAEEIESYEQELAPKSRLSIFSKALITVAVIMSLTGIALIIASFAKASNNIENIKNQDE